MNRHRRKEQFAILRRELESGLVQLELDGGGIDVAASELVKTGIALTIASRGPQFALDGMTALVDQIKREFSKDVARASGGNVVGHA
jgi:hypothetical protein